MARARKKKSKARRRALKRRNTLATQSSGNWQIGAGILALTVMLGAAIYGVALNDGARTSVANFVEKFELPQGVKELPETLKRNLPELPAKDTGAQTGKSESAPAQ